MTFLVTQKVSEVLELRKLWGLTVHECVQEMKINMWQWRRATLISAILVTVGPFWATVNWERREKDSQREHTGHTTVRCQHGSRKKQWGVGHCKRHRYPCKVLPQLLGRPAVAQHPWRWELGWEFREYLRGSWHQQQHNRLAAYYAKISCLLSEWFS